MGHWYEEAVFYHIYPLGLLGAPKNHESEEVVHRMKELLPWVDHMKELGCTAVYIGPLFESSSHGYDTRDYKRIDSRLGDEGDFKEFVEACHKAGIRVVVDGVFNHTGREFFAFLDIQKNRENSPYRNWYKGVNFGWNSPYNDGFSYEAWRNCYELANLNLQEEAVREYLFEVIQFWIQEFDIDGIRLDCADCLDFGFMKEMRRRTALAKEDFWLMGEVIHGDYGRWANEEILHSVTNYELHKGLYSGHNDHNYFEIAHTIRRQFDENGGIYKGRTLYSFADNHDVDRLASKLKVRDHLFTEYTLLYTLPGIPSLYYGSEWGVEGKKEGSSDDALRPELDLTKMLQMNEKNPLTAHLKKLGQLKKEWKALSYGKYKELLLTNRQYAFARILDGETIITAVNNDEKTAHMSIPVPISGTKVVELLEEKEILIENGRIELELEPAGSVCIQMLNEE